MHNRVLVAVAHGSADPRASATIAELAALAREREQGLDLRIAFLGHAPPSLPQVLSTIEADREVTVLPLLLTAAYHSKADIPRMLARMPRTRGPRLSYGATLGPHPLLLDALERRLVEKAELYAFSDLGEEGEIGSPSVPCRAERVWRSRPDTHSPPFGGQSGRVRPAVDSPGYAYARRDVRYLIVTSGSGFLGFPEGFPEFYPELRVRFTQRCAQLIPFGRIGRA